MIFNKNVKVPYTNPKLIILTVSSLFLFTFLFAIISPQQASAYSDTDGTCSSSFSVPTKLATWTSAIQAIDTDFDLDTFNWFITDPLYNPSGQTQGQDLIMLYNKNETGSSTYNFNHQFYNNYGNTSRMYTNNTANYWILKADGTVINLGSYYGIPSSSVYSSSQYNQYNSEYYECIAMTSTTWTYDSLWLGVQFPTNVPSFIANPIHPVISYNVVGKQITIDCLKSDVIVSGDSHFDTCNLFIDTTIDDSTTSNLTFYSGLSVDGTLTNVTDNDPYSDSHLSSGQRVTDSAYCDISQCYLTYSFDNLGTYYLKTTITTTDPISLTSVAYIPVIIDGSSFTGASVDGNIIPDIYKNCSLFDWTDPVSWLGCQIDNGRTWFISLFVPDSKVIQSQSTQFQTTMTNKLGFLFFPINFLITLTQTIVGTTTTPDCTLTMGSILSGHSVSYNYCSLGDSAPTVLTGFRTILIFLTSWGFLTALLNKWRYVMENQ